MLQGARQRPQRLLSVGLRADGKEEEAGDFGRRAEGQERGSRPPVAENLMTKIVLSASRDIPLNKLVLSQANVRRIKAGVSVDEPAEDIARRGLLQSLSVRAAVQAPAPSLMLDDGEVERRVRLIRPVDRVTLSETALARSQWREVDAGTFGGGDATRPAVRHLARALTERGFAA